MCVNCMKDILYYIQLIKYKISGNIRWNATLTLKQRKRVILTHSLETPTLTIGPPRCSRYCAIVSESRPYSAYCNRKDTAPAPRSIAWVCECAHVSTILCNQNFTTLINQFHIFMHQHFSRFAFYITILPPSFLLLNWIIVKKTSTQIKVFKYTMICGLQDYAVYNYQSIIEMSTSRDVRKLNERVNKRHYKKARIEILNPHERFN